MEGANNPRRSFLGKALKTTVGLAVLSSTTTLRALTKNEQPEGYNPYASERQDIRRDPFGKHVEIKGKIFDAKGKVPLKNATVEVWHLSPDSKKYRHRTKLYTNGFGEYRLLTDVPERVYGKSRRIHFKVSKGAVSYTTELAMNDWGAHISSIHWEKNRQLGEALLFPKHENVANRLKIDFNISLIN